MNFFQGRLRSLAYVLLIVANILAFTSLAHVIRQPDGTDETGAPENESVLNGTWEKLRERLFPDKAKKQEAARAAEKIARSETIIATRPKFSRTSFFLKSPIIGSIAIPQTWEGKYTTKESERSIDFIYAMPGDHGYPIFNISLVPKKDKTILGDTVIKELSDQAFVAKLYPSQIKDPKRAQEFAKMSEEAKAAWNSFKSYDQPKN